MYEDDLDYARQRLSSSFNKLNDGRIVWVENVKGSSVYFYTGDDVDAQVCNLSDINPEPIEMGYINTEKGVFNIERLPVRAAGYKHGIHNSNVSVFSLKDKGVTHTSFPSTASYLKAERVFPSFLSIVAKRATKAFHRDFALLYQGGVHKIFYKKYEVGVVENNEIVLNAKFGYLQEYLDEVVNG